MTTDRMNDEILLMSYLAGQCSAEEVEEVRRRLRDDEAFARLHQDLSNTVSAVRLLPELEPPADLTARTMARIRAAQRTQALLAREQLSRRGVARPTFSLREAAAMAAAVVVLGAIFIPSIQSARQRNARNLCAAQVGQIGHDIHAFAAENGEQLPSPPTRRMRWLPGGGAEYASNSSGLFRLINGGYSSPTLFQDPAVSTVQTFKPDGKRDFPGGRYIHYSYQHMLGDRPMRIGEPSLGREAEEMAILADETPLFDGGRFRQDRLYARASENHGGSGQNVLYLAGNVRWVESPDVGVDGNNIFHVDNVDHYSGVEAPAGPKDTFLLPAFVQE